jgi:membrane protease YdiL (CAAX protease family)
LGLFLVTLLLLWLPVAAPIYWLGRDPNLVTILTMGLLFGEFLLLLGLWGRRVYREPQLFKRYGLAGTRQNGLDLLKGLSIGLLFTFSLFALEGLLGWLEFRKSPVLLPKVILEGLVSALGIGFAEELVFRGWLLDELQRDYSPKVSLWADAIAFAGVALPQASLRGYSYTTWISRAVAAGINAGLGKTLFWRTSRFANWSTRWSCLGLLHHQRGAIGAIF